MKKVIISESESIALKDIIEHWFMKINFHSTKRILNNIITFYNTDTLHHLTED